MRKRMILAGDRERISCLEETVMLQRVAIKALAIRMQSVERAMPDQLAQEKARAQRARRAKKTKD